MPFDARLLTGAGVFVAVAEAGNFARAGEALGLSPSGVSRAVARLETRVGVRLFDRNPRSVTLTEEGRRFHDQVVPLMTGLEEAAADAAGSAATVAGRLRVSIDPWFARLVLAPRTTAFLARHPRLSLDVTTSNHREEMMAGVDIAVRFGPPDISSLVAVRLLETRIVTCASPAYLRRHGNPAAPADLTGHEGVLFRDPQTGRPFPWEFHRAGEVASIAVPGRLVADDPFVAIAACVAGQGLFQSFAIGLGPWLQRGDLVPVLTDWSEERYPLYAYHASRHLPPAKVRAFLDFLREAVAGHGGESGG